MENANTLETDNQLDNMPDDGASKIGSTSAIFGTGNTQTTIDTFDTENEIQWNHELEIIDSDGESETRRDNELTIEDEQTINEPYIGMEFGSADEVKDFYNIYAFKTGFSIRKSTHYKSKKFDNMISNVKFTCSKEGQPNQPTYKGDENTASQVKSTPKKEMPYKRTGCKAHIRARMVEPGKWVVSKFHNVHNHELIVSPSKSRFGRSHRKISKEQREIIHQLSEQNVSTSQIMSYLAVKEGGRQNIHFTRKDLMNEVSGKNRRLLGIDVSSALNYFRELQSKDSSFFYSIDVDDQYLTRNIFWVDGRSRMAYKYFNDVVTFDTTYMTNKYSMPFAPFIGVNHHRQSIFFGCALIRDETANTFCWLFRTWLEAMLGIHPKAIITDQDPAMKKAIEIVFPNTIHRCCQWHVMRKAREHLGVLYSTKIGFEEALKDCINYSLTVEEFENEWASLIEKYKLNDNNHLTLLWSTRRQWVPVFFRDTFFANMSTSQRSESINAWLKLLLDSHTSIYKFIMQFEKITTTCYEREDEEDFKNKDGEAHLWSYDPIERQARDIYTKAIFVEFRKHLRAATAYSILELEKNALYKICPLSQSSIQNRRLRSYMVSVDVHNQKISCNCKLFEFFGILCSHCLKVLPYMNMHSIPPHYILKRWTKEAKKGITQQRVGILANNEIIYTKEQMLEILRPEVEAILSEGTKSMATFEFARRKVKIIVDELTSLERDNREDRVVDDAGDRNLPMISQSSQINQHVGGYVLRDPPQSQCKGKRRPQRFKPPVEKKAKKYRTCQICKKKGHNRRTCKEAFNVSGDNPPHSEEENSESREDAEDGEDDEIYLER